METSSNISKNKSKNKTKKQKLKSEQTITTKPPRQSTAETYHLIEKHEDKWIADSGKCSRNH